MQSTCALLCLGSWSLTRLVKDLDVEAVTVLDEVEAKIELEKLITYYKFNMYVCTWGVTHIVLTCSLYGKYPNRWGYGFAAGYPQVYL